ncbi:MAG TPA: DUF421 domain-containing protein [Firmicutes bacterium]|jgi:uncharacterized membrane protein YcaP (DUF421 family)|nr:DUF421 domain-containing protein [Bacillota bacterium]
MPFRLMILFRSAVLFAAALFFIRILGKKHPSKMTPFRFVNYAVIAVITALMATNVIESMITGLVALSVWIVFPLIFDYLETRSRAVHDVLQGKETSLIKQGKIMEENLKSVRLTAEELLKNLRSKNVFSVADVEFAVLENDGEVNVLLKADKKPVTPHDLEWKVQPETEPQTVILEGNILHNPLAEMGLNSGWLQTELSKAGVSLDNVFLGQVNTSGELYLDLFDDAVKPACPSVRQALFAGLEKTQADLVKFALETEDSRAKWMFEKNAAKLQQITAVLRPYLLR